MYVFFVIICVQIILESLPVSSSGHIMLLESFLQCYYPAAVIAVSENKIVTYFLHGPTAIVLAVFFWDRWIFLLRHIATVWRIVIKIIVLAFVADLMSFLFYLFFNYVIDISGFPVGIGFVISCICLYSLRFLNRENYTMVTWDKALLIGALQGVALLPGVSRFGLTFVAGCWLGLSAKKSFEFSFAIQWPLIIAGLVKGISKISSADAYIFFNISMLFVTVLSSIVAFFFLNLVYIMALTNRLWIFSVFLLGSFGVWLTFCFF